MAKSKLDARDIGIAINGTHTSAAELVAATLNPKDDINVDDILDAVEAVWEGLLEQRLGKLEELVPGASKPSSSRSSGGSRSGGSSSRSSRSSGGSRGRSENRGREDRKVTGKQVDLIIAKLEENDWSGEKGHLYDGDEPNYEKIEGLSSKAASEIIKELIELEEG